MDAYEQITTHCNEATPARPPYVLPLSSFGNDDAAVVGGKNASLGEMIRHLKTLKIAVPDGFATTAEAYREFVRENHLGPVIEDHLLRWRKGAESLTQCGRTIRNAIRHGRIPDRIRDELLRA